MKRIIEAEMEIRVNNFEIALNRFFKKFPEIDYWREEFEDMYENDKDFECDNMLANGEKNNDWSYALHLDCNEDSYYMCVIERA